MSLGYQRNKSYFSCLVRVFYDNFSTLNFFFNINYQIIVQINKIIRQYIASTWY